MAVIKDLTPELVTNYFLYGQSTVPSNLLSDKLIRDDLAITRIEVDELNYMRTAGRFALASRFDSDSFSPLLLISLLVNTLRMN